MKKKKKRKKKKTLGRTATVKKKPSNQWHSGRSKATVLVSSKENVQPTSGQFERRRQLKRRIEKHVDKYQTRKKR